MTAQIDFFGQQEKARKRTVFLVFCFILAVVLIVASVYLLVCFLFSLDETTPKGSGGTSWWDPDLFLYVGGGTVAVILLGTLYKIAVLARGGEVVAGMLGGIPIRPSTDEYLHRKALNVVEEMAIASGVPVPPVYLLSEEKAINAFAAGYSPGDAVIGLTKGCLTELTRDELQGVVAHEFSHILNGDMKLNIRLMGVLHGILLIAVTGRLVFESGLRGMSHASRHRFGKKNDNPAGYLAVLAVGGILMAIGYIGVFFGKLIKSAVSRQREFLADAAAVQFTRNPAGIAGALKKIGGYTRRSRLKTPHAEEASHLFFSNALRESFVRLLSTHPPLEERIRRLDPSFPGEFEEGFGAVPGGERTVSAFTGPTPQGDRKGALEDLREALEQKFSASPESVMEQVGVPDSRHIAFAHHVLESLPKILVDAAQDPYGARALVYGLLLNREEEVRTKQIRWLSEKADPLVAREVSRLIPHFKSLDARFRLPLLDLAIPTLRSQSEKQFRTFKENIQYLVTADEKVSLFEFALQCVLVHHLDPVFGKRRPPRRRKKTLLRQSGKECRLILSVLAHAGQGEEKQTLTAFRNGVSVLSTRTDLQPLPKKECTLSRIRQGLDHLQRLSHPEKKKLIQACITTVFSDRKVTVMEAELLRAVAGYLDCPIPPILPDLDAPAS